MYREKTRPVTCILYWAKQGIGDHCSSINDGSSVAPAQPECWRLWQVQQQSDYEVQAEYERGPDRTGVLDPGQDNPLKSDQQTDYRCAILTLVSLVFSSRLRKATSTVADRLALIDLYTRARLMMTVAKMETW